MPLQAPPPEVPEEEDEVEEEVEDDEIDEEDEIDEAATEGPLTPELELPPFIINNIRKRRKNIEK